MEVKPEVANNHSVNISYNKHHLKTSVESLFHFYQVYNEVFLYDSLINSAKYCLHTETNKDFQPNPDQCVQNFRGTFRKHFRGLAYLSSTAFKNAHRKATTVAMAAFDGTREMEKALHEKLKAETEWIKQANNVKRDTVLNEMKRETLRELDKVVRKQFPNLFNEQGQLGQSMTYYEEDVLSLNLRNIKEKFIAQFIQEVPFKNEEEERFKLSIVTDLTELVDKEIVSVVVDHNQRRKQVVETVMNEMVQDAVSNYAKLFTEVTQGKLFVSRDDIVRQHTIFKKQCVPLFEDYGNEKCRKTYLQSYNEEISKTLKQILHSCNDMAQSKLETVKRKSIDEMQTCFQKLLGIFRNNGIPLEQLNGFKSTVLEDMDERIMLLKKANAENGAQIFDAMKNENYFRENTDERIYQIMIKLKTDYVQNLKTRIQEGHRNENGNKEESKSIQLFYKQQKTEMCKLVEMEIRRKVGMEEPVELHQQVLARFADSVFSSFISGVQYPTEKDSPIRNDIIVCKTNMARVQLTNWNSSPLAIQLSTVNLRMAVMCNGQAIILENEFGDNCTQSRVGLTRKHEFIYGSDLSHQLQLQEAKHPDCNLERTWDLSSGSIFQCLDTWRESLPKQSNEMHAKTITYELLLGFLLTKLKRSAERVTGQKVYNTVISIPYRFNSMQRVRVKDAAELAGFKYVALVNDGAAAAYFCLNSITPELESNHKVMALSHNGSNSVDIFLYDSAPVSGLNQLNMLEYRQVDTGNGKSSTQMLSDVRKACKDVTDSQVKSGDTLYIVTAWEFESGSRDSIIRTIAKELIGTQVAFKNGDEVVIKGTIMLAHNIDDIGIPVKDKLCFDVIQESTDLNRWLLLARNDYLPCVGNVKTFTAQIKNPHVSIRYQEGWSFCANTIGTLNIQPLIWVDANIILVVHFNVNHEAIITLVGTKKRRYGKSENASGVEWLSPNLSKEELEQQRILLDAII